MITRILVLFALLVPQGVLADDFPTSLFGVTLGMTATRTAEKPAGEMPVKQLTGLKPWNMGARYYYEPLQESESFPFLEYRVGDEKFYSTNHSSLVLPTIPSHFETFSEWEEHAKLHGEQFTVMTVEFTSPEFDAVKSAYLAAPELCEDFSKNIGEPSEEKNRYNPEIDDFLRTCIFTQDNRELEIGQYGPKYVYRLKYSDEYIGELSKELEEVVNKLKGNVTLSDS